MYQLKVHQQQSIVALREQGWSKRKIAQELALDRATVRKYLAQAIPKSPTPQTGSVGHGDSNSPTPHTGSEETPPSESPTPQTGSPDAGPVSSCDPWRSQIEQALQAGLSVQRIYQDLVSGHGFGGSYHAVRRFVRRR